MTFIFNCFQLFFCVDLWENNPFKMFAVKIKERENNNKPSSPRQVGTTKQIITALHQPADRGNQLFEQTSQLGGLWRQQQCQCQSRHSPADGAPHVAYVWRCTRRSARTLRPDKGVMSKAGIQTRAHLIGTFIWTREAQLQTYPWRTGPIY